MAEFNNLKICRSIQFKELNLESGDSQDNVSINLSHKNNIASILIDNSNNFIIKHNNVDILKFNNTGQLNISDIENLKYQLLQQRILISNLQYEMNNLKVFNNELKHFIHAFKESIYIDNNNIEYNYNELLK